jgi:hypothetical protein
LEHYARNPVLGADSAAWPDSGHIPKLLIADKYAISGDLLYDLPMSFDTGQLKDALQQIASEFEALVKSTLGGIGSRQLRHGARAADRYVRDNTYAAIAVVAAAAFMVGVLMTRRK